MKTLWMCKISCCVQGGLSTSNEMCLAFLYYYPAMNLSGCLSIPDSEALQAEMGATDYM